MTICKNLNETCILDRILGGLSYKLGSTQLLPKIVSRTLCSSTMSCFCSVDIKKNVKFLVHKEEKKTTIGQKLRVILKFVIKFCVRT